MREREEYKSVQPGESNMAGMTACQAAQSETLLRGSQPCRLPAESLHITHATSARSKNTPEYFSNSLITTYPRHNGCLEKNTLITSRTGRRMNAPSSNMKKLWCHATATEASALSFFKVSRPG